MLGMEFHFHLSLLARGPNSVGHQRQQHLGQQRFAALEGKVLHIAAVREPHAGQIRQPRGFIRHPLADHGQVKTLFPGKSFVVEFLGQLCLPGEAKHLKDQPALIGQNLVEVSHQMVFLQHPFHLPLHSSEVRQALPHPIDRVGKRGLFLFWLGQGTQNQEVPHLKGGDRHPIGGLPQGNLHRPAGMLCQGSQQIQGTGFAL